jgi:hypothetical protein
MTISPPTPGQQGQSIWLSLDFYDETSGSLTDPTSVTVDITYGSEAPLVPDTAGPYVWDGSSSSPAPETVWRTGTGQFTAWWDVPDDQPGGAYVATWTIGYSGDDYLVTENFPVAQLITTPVTSADVGYWTGSLVYQPAWSSSPLSIEFGTVDATGTSWLLQSVEGWDSPPAAVGQVIQRSADHGGYATAQYFGPRILTLTVWASSPTQAIRDQARALMQQVVPISDLGTFTYGEPVPKVAYVRRNASADVTETYPTLTDVIFTLPLVAPDPRKYDPDAVTQSSLTPQAPASPLALPFLSGFPVTFPAQAVAGSEGIVALNAGTFETRPVIVVTGPATSPSVNNASTGQSVTFTGLVLHSAAQLTLDMDGRQAFVGSEFQAADPSSSWFVLEPGETLVTLTGAAGTTGGSSISMSYSSAWI